MTEPTAMTESRPSRASCESLLRQKIKRLKIEADDLQALLGELPSDLSHPAERALWKMLTGR